MDSSPSVPLVHFTRRFIDEEAALAKPHAVAQPIDDATHVLCMRNEFLGTAFAVAPRIVLTAGHHYNSKKDEVGDFSVVCRVKNSKRKPAKVDYAMKHPEADLLILWLDRNVPFIKLRGFEPPKDSNISTLWVKSTAPYELMSSTGKVMEERHDGFCMAHGTITTQGSSGAPVVDSLGEYVVGMHVASNRKSGSRISEYLSAKSIITSLNYMEVDITAPYPERKDGSDEDEGDAVADGQDGDQPDELAEQRSRKEAQTSSSSQGASTSRREPSLDLNAGDTVVISTATSRKKVGDKRKR